MENAPEVSAVLVSISQYMRDWVFQLVLFCLPFIVALYVAILVIWWYKHRK